MKALAGLIFSLGLVAAAPSLSFFPYQQEIQAPAHAGQCFVVIDRNVWRRARRALGDLRLYLGQQEIPYALQIEAGRSEIEQKALRVLQPATVMGKTQFVLDMSGLSEYDRVELRIATTDFVTHARVEGNDQLHGGQWAVLGTTTLYDLSKEKLGRNSTLHIPLATYKYLRVTIESGVKPSDVLGGTAGITRSQSAVWRTIGETPQITEQGKDTVVTFPVPGNAPVERIAFEIDPGQPNFRREVELGRDASAWRSTRELARIHIQRNGQKIDFEQNSIDLRAVGPQALKLTIHNGDDAPLKITGASLQQFERRLYFDAAPGATYQLYYGDEKLEAPIYDYAKLFQRDANAAQAQLGAERTNPQFTGRPDGRPWTERHPSLLWGAIVAAVLILAGLALKSMRTAAA